MTAAVLACAVLLGLAVALLAEPPRRVWPPRAGRTVAGGWRATAEWLSRRDRVWRPGRQEAAVRAAVVELLDAVAAELRVGRSPREALRRGVDEVPAGVLATALAEVAESARLGGDVPAALHCAAAVRGAHALGWLAAAWQLAEVTGAGLAVALEQLAATGRADDEQRHRVAVQLAGPRATARLLAVLPLFGLLLGSTLGAGPVRVLLGTPVGWALTVLGVGLDVVGLWWTARLARAVEPPP